MLILASEHLLTSFFLSPPIYLILTHPLAQIPPLPLSPTSLSPLLSLSDVPTEFVNFTPVLIIIRLFILVSLSRLVFSKYTPIHTVMLDAYTNVCFEQSVPIKYYLLSILNFILLISQIKP